jgi:hypothetical protein
MTVEPRLVVLVAAAAIAALATGCKGEAVGDEPDRAALARQVLDDGHPKRALKLVESAEAGPALVVRMQALIALDEWGTYDKLLRGVAAGPDKDALKCLLAAARHDVWAVRDCRAPFEPSVLGQTL